MRVAGIIKESTVDGEGWRVALFMQGCKHQCKGCQNPQTWDFNGGTEMSKEEMLEELDKLLENPLIDGVTLSGGDPFFQAKELIPICKYIKKRELSIWAYTGFKYEEIIGTEEHPDVTEDMKKLLKYIDVLVDGKFIFEERTLEEPYRGSSNQKIVDVKQTMKNKKIEEWRK